jgi:hypothetical protein
LGNAGLIDEIPLGFSKCNGLPKNFPVERDFSAKSQTELVHHRRSCPKNAVNNSRSRNENRLI